MATRTRPSTSQNVKPLPSCDLNSRVMPSGARKNTRMAKPNATTSVTPISRLVRASLSSPIDWLAEIVERADADHERLDERRDAAHDRQLEYGVALHVRDERPRLEVDRLVGAAHGERPVVDAAHHDAFHDRLSADLGATHGLGAQRADGDAAQHRARGPRACHFAASGPSTAAASNGLPQVILPSGQVPYRQPGPLL